MAKFCPIKRGWALYLDCEECDLKLCENFFCLVVGSRSFTNYTLLKNKLDYLLSNHKGKSVIVSGGANGADALAKKYAMDHEIPYMEFPANWEMYGKQAGYKRNREMHEFISKMPSRGCVAFWDGKSHGTAHNFELAAEFHTRIICIQF